MARTFGAKTELLPGETIRHRLDEFKEVNLRSVVGVVEYRRASIGIDGDDQFCTAHAFEVFRRAGNAEREVQFRLHLASGFSHLPFLRQPAGVNHRTAAGYLCPDLRREFARLVDVILASDTTADAHKP